MTCAAVAVVFLGTLLAVAVLLEVTVFGVLSTRLAAAYTGVTEEQLVLWRGSGRGPSHIRVMGLIRYKPYDLDTWLVASREDRLLSHQERRQ